MAAMKRTYEITNQIEARGATLNALGVAEALLNEGKAVTLSVDEKKRSTPASDHFHGQIADIHKAMKSAGSDWSEEDWKRLLIHAFVKETPHLNWSKSRVVPSLDGQDVVQLGVQSRGFKVKQSSEFIEWLYAWGSEKGVTFLVDRRLEAQSRPAQRVAA